MEKQVEDLKVGAEVEVKFQPEPSLREKEVVADVFNRFTNSANERNLSFEYFDGNNLVEMINENVKRFITNIDERDDIEDWQARVFDPFTRNKVIAILGKVAQFIPRIEFAGEGNEDFRRGQILGDLYSYADRVDDNEELMFFSLLEAVVKGTIVGYEGHDEYEKSVKDIIEYDSGDKIKIKEGKVITRKLSGYIVPLEEFYPSSVGIRKIKNMPYCFWRSVITYEEFKNNFSHYKKSTLVSPFMPAKNSEETIEPFYKDYISKDVPENSVEIIRYYNQLTDEFVIIANGIWLNPFDEENVMPLPFNHKQLPFWSAIYEPLGNFFYGKGLPDKLKSMQDVINVLHNMMLDQSFLSIFPPILTDAIDDIEDDFLRPGRRIPVTDQAKYRELKISAPQAFHQFILEYTKRILEESSVDAVSAGMVGGGERTTATEIRRAAQGVTAILGLFAQFIKWGIKDKARLRAKNIFQFYKAPLVERVLGEGGSKEKKEAFNVFKIEDTVLTSGKRGVKIIEMYPSRKEMPTQTALRTQAKLLEREINKKVEKIAINPDYLRDFEFDIRLVPAYGEEDNKELNKALFMEYVRVVVELFPDMVDREELFAEFSTLFGYKPDKFKAKQQQGGQQNMAQMMAGGQENIAGGQEGAGNLGVSQNLINSLMENRRLGVRDMARQ